MFDLTDEERQDSKRFCAFSERLPQCPKAASKFDEEENKLRRKHFMKVIDTCWRHPDILMQAANWVEEKASEMAERGNDQLFVSISTLRALDEQWCARLLVKRTALKLKTLETACEQDSDSWRQLFMYGMVASGSLKIPKDGKDKLVCAKWIDQRVAACGGRWGRLENAKLLTATGVIDWSKWGVYSLQWDTTGRCTKIVHRPSGAEYDCAEHVVITKKFRIEENWSDFAARIVCKPTEYNIADDFFPKKPAAGPHLLEHWTASCSSAERAMDAAKREIEGAHPDGARKNAGDDEFLKGAKQKARKENMDKARAALQRKKTQINSKRSVTFE